MNRFILRRLNALLITTGMVFASSQVFASAFQIFEQDGASIGSYHAGYAAEANDASTAFYNPAGLTRFKNQQIVISGDSVLTDIKFKGNVTVSTIDAGFTPLPVTAQGGNYAFVPGMYYAAPVTDRIAFGFGVDVPFGSKVNYGYSTNLRYVSTQTSVTVIDISPVIALKITDKASLGFGPDIQPMKAEFNSVGTISDDKLDTDGINSADDTAYGFHIGGLYEFTPETRAGLSYHSQVVHHLTGTSSFSGPLADFYGVPIESDRSKVNLTLPAYTAFSFYHRVHPQWALMSSVIYTQWNVLKNLVLQDIAAIGIGGDPSNSIVTTIPQYFRNTWNFSLGANYYSTENVMLRGGVGYDQTPVRNEYRNVELPDNDHYVVALGGHYQATKALGLDAGWSHVFMQKAHVIPPPQVTGAETTTTNGSVTGGADVYALQVTWDFV